VQHYNTFEKSNSGVIYRLQRLLLPFFYLPYRLHLDFRSIRCCGAWLGIVPNRQSLKPASIAGVWETTATMPCRLVVCTNSFNSLSALEIAVHPVN
jgi:hypothetical protein